MEYQEIKKLYEVRKKHAVTITVNLNEEGRHRSTHDEIVIKNMVGAAEERLLCEYPKREVADVLEQLKQLEDTVQYTIKDRGMVLFAAEDYADFALLPFAPGNKLKIADHFVTRTLVRALCQAEHYYVLCISQNEVNLLECYNDRPIKAHGGAFPVKNETFYEPDRLKRSLASAEDKKIQAFFRTVEEAFSPVYRANPLPVVLAGVEEAISNYRAVIGKEKRVVGAVRGNFDWYDGALIQEIITRAHPIIMEYKALKIKESFADMEAAKGKNLLEYDLNNIYHLAQAGQVEELVVDEDYYQNAILGSNNVFFMNVDREGTQVDDAVNYMIQEVKATGGDVVFVPPYSIDKSHRMAAILRWR